MWSAGSCWAASGYWPPSTASAWGWRTGSFGIGQPAGGDRHGRMALVRRRVTIASIGWGPGDWRRCPPASVGFGEPAPISLSTAAGAAGGRVHPQLGLERAAERLPG